jgi:hypothetical protein
LAAKDRAGRPRAFRLGARKKLQFVGADGVSRGLAVRRAALSRLGFVLITQPVARLAAP